MPNIAINGLLGLSCGGIKSVVFDFADNWGHANVLGLRSIDFYYNSTKQTVVSDDITCYATPPSYGAAYLPENAFITSLSKTGTSDYTSWLAGNLQVTNQRLICNFKQGINIDGIKISNYHSSGNVTTAGVKNVKIHTVFSAVTSTTYNEAITDSTKIFDSTWPIHASTNTTQNYTLTLI